ncbi:unnamed protein product [Gongylonema pulchrum]|uniref:SSD domain-containing protein n=1 Tax=Gongylonema pulchrum TaxID=637853 RepID=A0A183D8J5_9BILA|nr:unnamed protein product [Gongylonema pulchrum]
MKRLPGCVTIAAYSVILYILVADVGFYTLFQWLSFAMTVDLVLIIYLVLFIITLRCCDLVIDEGPFLFKRNRNGGNQIKSSADKSDINSYPRTYQEADHLDGKLL